MKKVPLSRHLSILAAGVVAIAATTAAVVAAQPAAVITAAAEENQQNDDPAQIAATQTVVTHKTYLQEVVAVFYRSFQDIPWEKKCAEGKTKAPWVRGSLATPF